MKTGLLCLTKINMREQNHKRGKNENSWGNRDGQVDNEHTDTYEWRCITSNSFHPSCDCSVQLKALLAGKEVCHVALVMTT